MTTRWPALIFTIVVLLSASLTQWQLDFWRKNGISKKSKQQSSIIAVTTETNPGLSYEKSSLIETGPIVPRNPSRNWNVLDPKVNAESVLIQSLDNQFPFFHYNTYKSWPIASLTKLLTALVVLEDIGENKKIPIDAAAVATEGEAGNLKSGEVYTARDLLKIMLLTSSNDAAAAFENYLGKAEFVKLLNRKAEAIGMGQTVLHDASGLSDLNQSTASDLLLLIRYIVKHEPEILNWTRLQNFLVQPLNEARTQTIFNINPLVNRADFLGGKTGTADFAKENLAAILSFRSERIVIIILGSPNRIAEINSLFNWLGQAYSF
jgi:D-alanyl-D-alanine carboxypeptidase